MSFCDYCDCNACQNGWMALEHAQTFGGKWICSVCYDYEMCLSAPDRKGKGPCYDETGVIAECIHRPQLISEWKEWKEWNKNGN